MPKTILSKLARMDWLMPACGLALGATGTAFAWSAGDSSIAFAIPPTSAGERTGIIDS